MKGISRFYSFTSHFLILCSGSGKTQFALQLSLLVQLPSNLGGLNGSACYLTSQGTLPTTRLVQLSKEHPLLSPSLCGLRHVHTSRTNTLASLMLTLTDVLPGLILTREADQNDRPIKLLVIDSLTPLLDLDENVNEFTARAKASHDIAKALHDLSSRFNLAILLIGNIRSNLSDHTSTFQPSNRLITYRSQAKIFKTDSQPLSNDYVAPFGLSWANQIAVRMTMSIRNQWACSGVQRMENPINGRSESSRLRNLSIIFSTVSAPKSVDFLITSAGLCSVDNHNP